MLREPLIKLVKDLISATNDKLGDLTIWSSALLASIFTIQIFNYAGANLFDTP